VQRDDLRRGQRCIERQILEAHRTAFFVRIRIVRQNLATEPPFMIRATAAPILPAPTIPTVRRFISKPSSPSKAKLPSRTRVRTVNVAVQCHHHCDGVFGDRLRRIPRHARDLDAEAPRGWKIDVVEARGAQHDGTDFRLRQVFQDMRVDDVVHERANGIRALREHDRIRSQTDFLEHESMEMMRSCIRCFEEAPIVRLGAEHRDIRCNAPSIASVMAGSAISRRPLSRAP
jgi:hypothetical protein